MITQNTGAAKPPQPQIEFIDSENFAITNYSCGWLVDGVLVQGQPAVIGGPKKSLKTSLSLDLAISLGTGTPFLGKFKVPQRCRVAVISGESGEATLQETAERICDAKGVRFWEDCNVLWSFTLPKFQDAEVRRVLTCTLRENKVEVVIIDPLYLCLLDGATDVSASNIFEIGPLLRRVADACLTAGATPVLVHPAKSGTKQATGTARRLELDDLMFSGVGEFTRQWLLISRTQAYQPGTGRHQLLLTVGGSAGQSGCWPLTICEGTLSNGSNRTWQVEVHGFNGAYETLAKAGRRTRCSAKAGGTTIRHIQLPPGMVAQ